MPVNSVLRVLLRPLDEASQNAEKLAAATKPTRDWKEV